MSESEEKKPTLSKYGRVVGRPRGRKDSDLRRVILGIMSRYKVIDLVWADLKAARAEMTPKERFQASVILAELGLKASPKQIDVNQSSNFSLIIRGLDRPSNILTVDGETVSDGALPRIPAREDFGDAASIKRALPAPPDPPVIEREIIDDRRQKIIRAEGRTDWNLSDDPRPVGVVDA